MCVASEMACPGSDECAAGMHDCGEHATCTNTDEGDGFACSCDSGFTGDGKTCVACTTCPDDQVVASACTATADTQCAPCAGACLGDPGWPKCDPTAASQKISFVHVNDIHATYYASPSLVGRPAFLRGFYEQVKAENPFTLFTNAGDDYEKGSVAEQLSRGISSREITWAMEFDVRTLGNHDFAWSQAEVFENARDPHAKVLSTNVWYVGDDPAGFAAHEFTTLQVGCIKIGFFGLISAPWDETNMPVEERYYPDMPTDLDFTGEAQSMINKHRSEVDLMVAINHIGLGRDLSLAADVPGIDVILSGHTHEITPEAGIVGDTLIVQAGAYGQNAVRLDVDVSTSGAGVVGHNMQLLGPPYTDDAVPSTGVQATIAAVLDQYAPDRNEPIGYTTTSVFGQWVAEIAGDAARSVLMVDAAIIDDDTVRGPLPEGALSQEDCHLTFTVEREPPGSPGFTSFYTVTLSGSALAEAAEIMNTAPGWTYRGPAELEPSATYTLALQKRTAFHPEPYGLGGLWTGEPQPQREVWDVLAEYAAQRTAACQYLDIDTPLPNCP